MPTFNSHSLYYLIRSGRALKQAQAYRAAHIRLTDALRAVAVSLGAEKWSICSDMMLLQGVVFPGKIPAGYSKPNRRGLSRPLRIAANMEIRKHFTPDGCHTVKRHPDLEPFFAWLGCPEYYNFSAKGGSVTGSTRIGRVFDPVGLGWYSETGPILLWTPNVERERTEALAQGYVIENAALDWKPPMGLRQILRQEWDLMHARYNVSQGLDPDGA